MSAQFPKSQDSASNRPLRFTSVVPATARLQNALAGRYRPVEFQWNNKPAVLQFSTLVRPGPSACTLNLNLDGHDLQLGIQRVPDLSALASCLAGIDLACLPSDLSCGVLAVGFAEGLEALKEGGLDVTLCSLDSDATPLHPPLLSWTIDRGDEQAWTRGWLSASEPALAHLASLVSRIPPLAAHDYLDLPFRFDLCAGRSRISLDELSSVRPSDAILADLAAWHTHGVCEVLVAGLRFASATLAGRSLTIHQTAMTDPTATVNTDSLEVELTFLVGSESCSLRDLRSLVPGACFELSTTVASPITICANGRPIGAGELLEIGDRLGVRVIQLTRP